jgi:hypothetical protein
LEKGDQKVDSISALKTARSQDVFNSLVVTEEHDIEGKKGERTGLFTRSTQNLSLGNASVGLRKAASKSLLVEHQEKVTLRRVGSLSVIKDPMKGREKEEEETGNATSGIKRVNSSRLARLGDQLDSGKSSLVLKDHPLNWDEQTIEKLAEMIGKMDLVKAAQSLNECKSNKAFRVYRLLPQEIQTNLEAFLNSNVLKE